MRNKFTIAVLSSILALTWNHPVLSQIDESEVTEIEFHCYRFPSTPVCKHKESVISLKEWDKTETMCSFASEWGGEEKKCKVIVKDSELFVYVEKGILSDEMPNTLATELINIPLDNIFAFNTQWWLASQKSLVASSDKVFGSFPNLEIGFISTSNNSKYLTPKYLTISANSLHQVIEQIESWRYYLPDLTTYENQLKFNPSRNNADKNISNNIAKLEKTNECSYCNLKNADLSGMDLEKADLRGADLRGADLRGANLEESSLKRAYLLGANLNRANLSDANLENINLMFASLNKANLNQANLKGANLQNANLTDANLSDATLKARKLENTNLKNANFTNANLTQANLSCANLQFANLTNANLTDADLSSCEKDSSYYQPSNLKITDRSYLGNLGLNEDPDIALLLLNITSNITGAFILNAFTVFQGSKVTFYLDTNLSGANLSGANLTNTNLDNTQLTDVNLSQAVFNNTKFSGNNLSNANFIDTDISEVDFGDQPILICEATFSDESVYEKYCQEEEGKKEKGETEGDD